MLDAVVFEFRRKYFSLLQESRKKLKHHVKQMENTVKTLEDNLKESNQTNNKVMMSLQNDKIKYQGISNQLEEALKENQQLLSSEGGVARLFFTDLRFQIFCSKNRASRTPLGKILRSI
jgi:mevalonate kinase